MTHHYINMMHYIKKGDKWYTMIEGVWYESAPPTQRFNILI